MSHLLARVLTLTSLLTPFVFGDAARAQQTSERPPASPTPAPCDPARALSLVEQQASEAQMIADVPKRVAIMVRTADLLWTQRRKAARELFEHAFDLALGFTHESRAPFQTVKGRADSKSPPMIIEAEDLRFVVLRAVGRRDVAWSKELAQRAARAEREERAAADKLKAEDFERERLSRNLLGLAESLWEFDRAAAADVFRMSLATPASHTLPYVLFKFAETDARLADALFREALAAYAASLEDLIYLSPFPFGYVRPIADTYVTAHTAPPPNFAPQLSTQQLYVEALLRAAQRSLNSPPEAEPVSIGRSVRGQIFTALTALEPFLASAPPHLAERAAQLKAQAAAAIREQEQKYLTTQARRPLTEGSPRTGAGGGEDEVRQSVEDVLKRAAQEPDPERRDEILVNGLMSSIHSAENVERLVEAAQQIGDDYTRRQFLDHLFFLRSQRALQAGALEEAARLAERVEALDQRALLLLLVAEAHLKRPEEADRVAGLLDAVAAAAERSPETEVKARILLGLAHLAARHDQLRAQRALAEAVKVVNKLEAPDVLRSFILRRIEGRGFTYTAGHHVLGFSLENVFRELGGRDIEATVAVAYGLDDRHLRALSVLAFSTPCLESWERAERARREEAERKRAKKKTPAKQAPR